MSKAQRIAAAVLILLLVFGLGYIVGACMSQRTVLARLTTLEETTTKAWRAARAASYTAEEARFEAEQAKEAAESAERRASYR